MKGFPRAVFFLPIVAHEGAESSCATVSVPEPELRGWSLWWRVGDITGRAHCPGQQLVPAVTQEKRGQARAGDTMAEHWWQRSPEYKAPHTQSYILPTQSWGKKSCNLGMNGRKATKRLLLPVFPKCKVCSTCLKSCRLHFILLVKLPKGQND